MSLLAPLLKDAASRLPEPLGRVPYAAALALARLLLRDCEAWPRNSYVDGPFTPGRSDLDLTLWFDAEPDARELARTAAALRATKRLFPALGEANVYAAPDAPTFARFLNPLALLRDPGLGAKLGRHARKPSQAETAAYLLRALEADRANLVAHPEQRLAKWNRHLELVGTRLGDPALAFAQLTDSVARAAAPDASEAERARLAAHLREYCRSPDLPRHDLDDPCTRDLATLYPHKFAYLPPPRGLASWQRELIGAQLAWEIAGLLSQYLLSSDRRQQAEHVGRVFAFLECVDGGGELREGARYLKDRLEGASPASTPSP